MSTKTNLSNLARGTNKTGTTLRLTLHKVGADFTLHAEHILIMLPAVSQSAGGPEEGGLFLTLGSLIGFVDPLEAQPKVLCATMYARGYV